MLGQGLLLLIIKLYREEARSILFFSLFFFFLLTFGHDVPTLSAPLLNENTPTVIAYDKHQP